MEAAISSLSNIGCAVFAVDDPAEFVARCESTRPDAAVVTVGARQRTALLAVAKWVRQKLGIPTIVVTERDDVDARVQAIGFDGDTAVAPLAPTEAVARVSALVRKRREHEDNRQLVVGDLRIDRMSRQVTRRGATVDLTARELDVLLHLVEHRDAVVAKTALLDHVWPNGHVSLNSVEAQVSALRRKLNEYGPNLIHTAYGQGYSFRATSDDGTRARTVTLAARERQLREREEALERRARRLRSLERLAVDTYGLVHPPGLET
jgi:DNA-binding response OmpR family regulator